MKSLHGSLAVLTSMHPKITNLGDAISIHQGLPKLNERATVRKMSYTGGQGIKHYKCKGLHETKICLCYKVGRKCTSLCHEGNKICMNY